MEVGSRISGFVMKRIREMKDCEGKLYEMEHEKTGAKLCWLKREDENKTFCITFRTPPENDTGVFHVLEHTVLNGSKKYPVKEPFNELQKSSMNTYLNAVTFSDKTMYPVSSRNARDFMNLVSVYLDAVCDPLIYSNPNSFYQEGWHYELSEEDGELTCSGVVLNEMKGAFTSVDETIIDEMNRMLFPDTCYRFVSGGDPACITDLTYEQFLDTHRRYYHPSNSRIFLDGNLDLEPVLALIDSYFDRYEKKDMHTEIKDQVPVKGYEKRYPYAIMPDENPENLYQISFAKIVSDWSDTVTNLLWDIICGEAVCSNESILVKPFLEAGISQDVELELINGIRQPWLILTMRNTNEKHLERIREMLREIAGNLELDHASLHAGINQMEFHYHEKYEPVGRINASKAVETWIYDGDPAASLQLSEVFDILREKVDQGCCEEMLKEFLLDEEHLCTLVSQPSVTLLEEQAEKERARLAALKETLDIEAIREMNEKLLTWQMTPDSKEALASLPRLTLADVPAKVAEDKAKETRMEGVPVYVYPAPHSDIAYLNFYFSLAGIRAADLPVAAMALGLLGELRTKSKTLNELLAALRSEAGLFSFDVASYSPEGRSDACLPVYTIALSMLKEKTGKVLELVREILQETIYEKETILPLVVQNNEAFRQTLINSGQQIAGRRVSAQYSAEGVFREMCFGYEAGMYSRRLENDYDGMIDDFIDVAQMVREEIFCRSRLAASVTAGSEAELAAFLKQLPFGNGSFGAVRYPLFEKKNEAITIPASGIGFAVLAGNLHEAGLPYDPRFMVLSHILSYGYLWNEVRTKNNAYGTGFGIGINGNISAYSYRDPSPLQSLKVFADLKDYIASLPDEDFDSYIIGALAAGDPLLSPPSKIRLEDARHFRGMTKEMRQKNRDAILNMKAADLRAYAEAIDGLMKKATGCVVASSDLLAGAEGFEFLKGN